MDEPIKNYKTCVKCRFYSAVYIRGYLCFVKRNSGLCLRHRKIVKKEDKCDLYKTRHAVRTEVTLREIDETIEAVKELFGFLKE